MVQHGFENVHAPTGQADDSDKDTFYDELDRLFDRLPKDYGKIVFRGIST